MESASDSPKSVGVWVRVSTEDQVRGESPEHHEKRARAYAEAKGWQVAEVYRLDAVSGKAVMGHAEAKRMLADIRSRAITGLVFSKLARLARNTKELLEFGEIFRECGADLVSLQEAIDTSSPAGRLFFTMIAAMAQWEREEIAERVQASIPIRAKLGKPTGGAATFGYRWRDKRLEPDPEEAPIRALVYELYAEHQRRRTVARLLNDRGYRTRSRAKFSDTTIERLIRDPTAKGIRRANYTRSSDRARSWELKPESDWVFSEVEAIVSQELWERCNGILAAQRANAAPAPRKTVHLFSGLARCGCGARMYPRLKMQKYVCERCRNKIPLGDLESVFKEQLHAFLVSPRELTAYAHAAEDAFAGKKRLVESAAAELAKIGAESDRVYALYLDDLISKEEFGRRHRPIADRRAQLEGELPRLEAEIDVMRVSIGSQADAVSGARDLWERWDEFPSEQKRQIVETITNRIVVGRHEIEIDLVALPKFESEARSAMHAQGFIAATSCTRAG